MQTGIFTLCSLVFLCCFSFVALETWRRRSEPSFCCLFCVFSLSWRQGFVFSVAVGRTHCACGDERGGGWGHGCRKQGRGSVRCSEVGIVEKWRIGGNRAAGWTVGSRSDQRLTGWDETGSCLDQSALQALEATDSSWFLDQRLLFSFKIRGVQTTAQEPNATRSSFLVSHEQTPEGLLNYEASARQTDFSKKPSFYSIYCHNSVRISTVVTVKHQLYAVWSWFVSECGAKPSALLAASLPSWPGISHEVAWADKDILNSKLWYIKVQIHLVKQVFF